MTDVERTFAGYIEAGAQSAAPPTALAIARWQRQTRPFRARCSSGHDAEREVAAEESDSTDGKALPVWLPSSDWM